MNYKRAQKQLLSGKGLGIVDTDTIKYVAEPIGAAIVRGRGRPKAETPAKWSDRIKCKICGKEYTRSAVMAHKATQFHKLHEKFDEKIRKIMLEE